ncbi:Protein CBG25877 [Caenorhabditis briggsae]|uniref:Protein CBG25877 n=1 Tax=Caenorhabditis briggsae TaxID=6238 RepID=B6IHN2_CAEBR|nr:Protein CBG25877 [Caenorhabditis briggsae]CAR99388.1 Protein CBG25877 [Caenorhabditis briggsae]
MIHYLFRTTQNCPHSSSAPPIWRTKGEPKNDTGIVLCRSIIVKCINFFPSISPSVLSESTPPERKRRHPFVCVARALFFFLLFYVFFFSSTRLLLSRVDPHPFASQEKSVYRSKKKKKTTEERESSADRSFIFCFALLPICLFGLP